MELPVTLLVAGNGTVSTYSSTSRVIGSDGWVVGADIVTDGRACRRAGGEVNDMTHGRAGRGVVGEVDNLAGGRIALGDTVGRAV